MADGLLTFDRYLKITFFVNYMFANSHLTHIEEKYIVL